MSEEFVNDGRISISTDGEVRARLVPTESLMPAVGVNEVDPPFTELPFDVAVAVDKVLEADFWSEYTWEGRPLILVSDTFLTSAAENANKTFEEAADGAWSLERGDGRRVYIWSAPTMPMMGMYGAGKPTLARKRL